MCISATIKSEPASKSRCVNPDTPFSYIANEIPLSYTCYKCGCHGVKLWRHYNTFVVAQELFCAKCAGDYYKETHSDEIPKQIAWLKENDIEPVAGVNYMSEEELAASLVVDSTGRRSSLMYICGKKLRDGGKSDQIGLLIPAVPTEENDTFWGYSAVPDAGVTWWRTLLTYL